MVRIGMVVLVCVGMLVPLSAQYAPYEPDWNKPAVPHRIIGPVHYVGTNELGVYLIATPKGHILLDVGFDESVPLVRDAIRKLGFRYEDVRTLLSSQAHFDHAAGLARVKRETGARLAAMQADVPLLEAGGKNDFVFGDRLAFAPVQVDRVLKDGDTIELGGVTLTARHTPGHTKGSTTFVMRVEEQGRPHTVVFVASTSVNPGTQLVNNPKYPQLVSDYERTFRLLKSLAPDVWVAGHAQFFDLAGKQPRAGQTPNPYVDPEGYRRQVARSEEAYRKLLAEEQRAPGGVR